MRDLDAQRFKDVVGDQGQIARLGGDEFAVISPMSSRQDAIALAHRIADALSDPFELEEMVVDVHASVGIALFPDHGHGHGHGHGVEILLQKADVAMYRAKETRSSVALYDERHDHHSPAKLALTAELRTAVDTEEIVLWFQPELDLRTREVMAVEALVRWDHPRLGVLPPRPVSQRAQHRRPVDLRGHAHPGAPHLPAPGGGRDRAAPGAGPRGQRARSRARRLTPVWSRGRRVAALP